MTCVIIGVYCLMAMRTHEKITYYPYFALLAFGASFFFAKVWKNLSKPGVFISLIFAAALALLAAYTPRSLLYILFDIKRAINFHQAWFILNIFIGIPGMTIIFKKFKD